MSEVVLLLGYEKKFYDWARKQGFHWRNVSYERSTGGRVSALQICHTSPSAKRRLVVVCHATGNDKLYPLTHCLRILLTAGFDVFTFDLDGHGRHSTTTLLPEHIGSMLPDAMRQVHGANRYRDVYLLGQSIGAALILQYLGRHTPPDNIAAAVCIAMPFRIHQGLATWRAECRSPLLATFWRQIPEYGVTGIIPALGPFKRRTYPIRLSAQGKHRGAFGYVNVITDILQQIDLQTTAAAVTHPVLILTGEADAIAPPPDNQILAHVLPSATMLPVARENHFSMLLSKDAVLHAVHWLHSQ